jgi:hypothetical protein
LGTGVSYRMHRSAPHAIGEQVDGDVDREVRQLAPRHAVVGEQVVDAEAPDERIALRAAVGDVAALDAGARAVAQRADAELGQLAGVDHGHEDAVDVGQRQEAAAILGQPGVDEDADDGPHRGAARPAGVADRQQRGRQPASWLAPPTAARPARLRALDRWPVAPRDPHLPPSHHGRSNDGPEESQRCET